MPHLDGVESTVKSPGRSQHIRRVVILGHTGFIGSHLVSSFQGQCPGIDVVGHSLPSMDLVEETEVASLSDLFDRQTAVVMCAAIKRQLGDNQEAFAQNVKIVANLCRLLQDYPVRRFIYFSSAAVYGEDVHNTNISEETPVCPTSYYGIAKYTSECLLRKVAGEQGNNSLLIVRPPTVYGPGDQSSYSPSGFLRAAIRKEQVALWGDGSERREFVFVEDIAKLIYRLTFHEYSGVLNIASGQSYTFTDAIGVVSRLVPPGLRVDSRPRTKKKADQGFSNGVLKRLFPDFSFTRLEEGIRSTLQKEYPNILAGVPSGVEEISR